MCNEGRPYLFAPLTCWLPPLHNQIVKTALGTQIRDIKLTSYAEIVLASPAADAAQPAFSNLFVQREFAPELGALLATRQTRNPNASGGSTCVEGRAFGATNGFLCKGKVRLSGHSHL